MTPYEKLLQERAVQILRISSERFNDMSNEGFNSLPDSIKEIILRPFIKIAALSLEWSANDFEKGYNTCLAHHDIKEALLNAGLKPQTETL